MPTGCSFTFDDGPTPGITEWILSTLDKYDAKATFFVLGKNVEMYPRPVSADPRCRTPDRQPHLLAPEGLGHEPRTLYGGCRFCQRLDPQRAVPSSLCADHPGAGPFSGPALQTGDVGYHLARLQPQTLAPDLPTQRHEVPCPGAIVVFHDSEKAFRNMRYALPRTLEKIRQMGLRCKAIEL